MPGLDAPAVPRSRRRPVLGLLSENELQGPSTDQVSPTRNLLLLRSVTSLQGTYAVMSSLSCVCLPVCRPARFPNPARALTGPTSDLAVVPPAPALTCTWRRPVKLSSQPLDSPWAQITQTPSPQLWKTMTRGSCWT